MCVCPPGYGRNFISSPSYMYDTHHASARFEHFVRTGHKGSMTNKSA